MTEVRLIDANALKDRLPTFAGVIDEQPTIEPELRHGRWIDAHMISGGDFYRCSECGCYIEQIYFANDYNVRYCPNCGTKMDGGAEQ